MKYLLTYKLFEGKLIMVGDPFEEDIKWAKTIDISMLWKKYESGSLSLLEYNKQLSLILEENDKKIFGEVISELKNLDDLKTSYTIWNKIYDIADENLIELK